MYGLTASGISIYSSSQVRSSVVLVLPIVEHSKAQFWGHSQWHDTYTKSHPNLSSSSEVELCGQTDKQTHIISFVGIYSMHFM